MLCGEVCWAWPLFHAPTHAPTHPPIPLCSLVVMTCAAPADVTCGGQAPAPCSAGYIFEADIQACSPCQTGEYFNATLDQCLAW